MIFRPLGVKAVDELEVFMRANTPPSNLLTDLKEGLGSFGNLYVARGAATSALMHFRSGLQTQFVGDSKILVDCLLGYSCCKTPDMGRSLRLAHLGLQTLVQTFFVAPPLDRELAQQVP